MHYTRIVTSFLSSQEKYLILKRSHKVRSMRGLWGGVSGIIEGSEEPLQRAKIEIFEETGISENNLNLLRSASQMAVSSQYSNHGWIIHPFLFTVKESEIKLNWENSEYTWIGPEEITNYKTVPSLDKVLARLL
ncbi:MAG TPA: NUDIX domain-containing protein [Nitrosopumilaceae archaeon]|nr:NUDIX domain-containing protein [Nitrosopumilaceae archaeon]